MKITRNSVFVVTAASLLTFTYGYSFTSGKPVENEELAEPSIVNKPSRIYGGTEADIDDYPFLASLRVPLLSMTMCSGTLIHPQYILTAAHCANKVDSLIAIFGTNASTGFHPDEGVLKVPVIAQYHHPGYRKKQHLYDVGVLKLERPIKRRLAKLCAPDGSDNEVGRIAKVAGWGKTSKESNTLSPILKEIALPIISNAECGKAKKYIGKITEGMLCAGTGSGRDTCFGDSGGPLIVKRDIIIGCVSWGSTCGEQAGVFTRLTYVMDYIDDILAGGDGSKFEWMASDSLSMEEQPPPPPSSSGKSETSLMKDMIENMSGSLPGSKIDSGMSMLMNLLSSGSDMSHLFGTDLDSNDDPDPDSNDDPDPDSNDDPDGKYDPDSKHDPGNH